MPPFEVFSLRFGRCVHGRRLIADIDVERRPLYPGTDWDAIRDAADPAASHAAVAVLLGRATRLDLFVRFSRFPGLQTWEIWAEDARTSSPVPRVVMRRFCVENPGCVSREVPFGVEIATETVGRFDVAWRWHAQYLTPETLQPEGEPDFLGETRFRLFSILDVPRHAPWTEDPVADPDGALPRVGALNLASALAGGAATAAAVGRRITEGVFELGAPSTVARRLEYGQPSAFVCEGEHDLFRLSAFLQALEGVGSDGPVRVACGDVAAAVCVLGNVLGANLHREMVTIERGRFRLPVINLIGVGPSQPADWANHVVAADANGIFDACLQIDMDPGPGVKWHTPAGMPFGDDTPHPAEPGYRHLLLPFTGGAGKLAKMAKLVIDKPAVDPPPRGPVRARFERIRTALASAAPPSASLPADLTFRGLELPDHWSPLAAEFEDRRTSAAGAWEHTGDAPARIVIDGELAGTPQDALALAAWRLTFYDSDLTPSTDPRFPGAIVCASDDERHAVLVYRNGVLRLRDDGERPGLATSLFAGALSAIVT